MPVNEHLVRPVSRTDAGSTYACRHCPFEVLVFPQGAGQHVVHRGEPGVPHAFLGGRKFAAAPLPFNLGP